jgi:RHS repeat-associated protein
VSSYPSMPDASGIVPTTYAYDPAGHLTMIGAGGHVTAFGIDALGRHASQQVDGGTITTYGYLGTANTVSWQSILGTTVYSGIDAIGDRITTTQGGYSVYVIADLHGNVTATADTSSGPNYLTAYRYDAYGETCAAYLAGSLTSDSNPWRFQGRILQNASGQTDLYDFGARSYDPSLGAFTSFDSVAGSARTRSPSTATSMRTPTRRPSSIPMGTTPTLRAQARRPQLSSGSIGRSSTPMLSMRSCIASPRRSRQARARASHAPT